MTSWRLACALAAARCACGLRAPTRRVAPRAPRRASASKGTILEAREVANKKAERRRIAAEQPSGGGGDFGGVAFEAFEGQVGLLFRGAIERLCAANRFPFSVPFIRQGSLQI